MIDNYKDNKVGHHIVNLTTSIDQSDYYEYQEEEKDDDIFADYFGGFDFTFTEANDLFKDFVKKDNAFAEYFMNKK